MTLARSPTQKLFPKSHFTVYNAEIFFVTSYNPMAWVVKRQKLNFKKVFFWNTLMWNYLPEMSRKIENKKKNME